MAVGGDRWREIAPHLDRALELPEEERREFLGFMRAQDPHLADDLEGLLAEHRALVQEGFLEAGLPASGANLGGTLKATEGVAAGGTPGEGPGPLAGRTLGEFELRKLVGAGGFGDVYLAEQVTLRREAVVKVLRSPTMNPERAKRFLREAHLASRLDHPYAAHVYAFGSEPDGVCWIAMERVRGSTLHALLEAQGPMPIERFVPLLERICEVVHSAHEQGIVHRDLKPENVMVISRAGRLLPKLLDLGIARALDTAAELPPETIALDDGAGASTTRHGAVFGSPPYMAPELWVSSHDAGPPADQYALAALAYEALTGQLAFKGNSMAETKRAHQQGALAPLGGDFDAELDNVLHRALAREPALRYENVLVFAQAFREASGIGTVSVEIPQLDDEVSQPFLASAPQPIADAIAAYQAARNAHQAREALRGLVRIAGWYLGILAAACRSRTGSAGMDHTEGGRALLHKLRRQGLTPGEWVALARHLILPFVSTPDVFPIPELVLLLRPDASRGTDWVAACLDGSLSESLTDSSEEAATKAITRELPAVTALLRSLTFLLEYSLVVPGDGATESWMGRSGPRPTIAPRRPLPPGRVAVIDHEGLPLLALWPLAQIASPMPGHAQQIFLLAGPGRDGARLVSAPQGFEHHDPELWDWFRDHLLARENDPNQAWLDPSPYRGLSPYTAADARWFFGRERETQMVVNRLRVESFVAVVGPSGVGKSSFAHAGVASALDGWRTVGLRPGRSPIAQLGLALKEAAGVYLAVGATPGQDADTVDRLRSWAAEAGGLLLVVDQFEEVFTLGCSPDERERFVRLLLAAVQTAGDPIRVVITLRDDFLIRVQQLPGLAEPLARGLQLLGPLEPAALERILVEPARRVGYQFEDGLPTRMLAAAAGTHAAVALLSFTAARLWELRDRHFQALPSRAYDAIGGVGGALARHADDTVDAMPAAERGLVRKAFRHLVTSEGTRAVIGHQELEQLLGGGPEAGRLIESLLAARLLTSSEDERGGTAVEIVHEALLEAWPRLIEWRREDLEGTRLHEQLRSAARQWQERGRPRGLLWRGDALAEYEVWRKRHGRELTPLENAFATVSVADSARGHKIRRVAVGTAVVMTAVFVAILWRSNQAERHSRVEAVRLLRESTSERARANRQTLTLLEDRGRDELERGHPFRAVVYLAEAFRKVPHSLKHRALLSEAVRATDAVTWISHDHKSAVRHVSFSHDDKRILTASFDGIARILDADSGGTVRTFRAGGRLTCSAFSPDDLKVVTGSMEGELQIWNVATGERIVRARRSAGEIIGCSISPDGRDILTISRSGTAHVWDAATAALRTVLPGSTRGISFGTYSPDGRRIVLALNDGTTRVFDARTGRVLRVLEGGENGAWRAIASFSPDGRYIVVPGSNGVLHVRDARSWRLVRELRDPSSLGRPVEWSRNGEKLVSAASDGTMRLWDVRTGRSETLYQSPKNPITAAFVKNEHLVLAVSADFVRLVNERAVALTVDLPGHVSSGSDHAIAISRDGERAAAAAEDGTIFFLQLGNRFSMPARGESGVGRLQYSPTGNRLAIAEVDGDVSIVDLSTRKTISFKAHDEYAFRVVWSPDGSRLLTVPFGDGDDLRPRLWDAGTGALIRELKTGGRWVYSAAFDPKGEVIATAGRTTGVRLWSARTGAQQGEALEAEGHAIAYSPDGRRLATGFSKIRIWDVASRAPILELEGHPKTRIDTLAFDSAGARLVSAGWDDHLAKIWDASTGRLLATLAGHTDRLMSARFSPDGKYVATAGGDPAARLWDAKTGDLLRVIPGAFHGADFSPDGTRLATDIGENVIIWDITLDQRSPEQLAAYVASKSPWKLVDGRLVLRDSPRRLGQ